MCQKIAFVAVVPRRDVGTTTTTREDSATQLLISEKLSLAIRLHSNLILDCTSQLNQHGFKIIQDILTLSFIPLNNHRPAVKTDSLPLKLPKLLRFTREQQIFPECPHRNLTVTTNSVICEKCVLSAFKGTHSTVCTVHCLCKLGCGGEACRV